MLKYWASMDDVSQSPEGSAGRAFAPGTHGRPGVALLMGVVVIALIGAVVPGSASEASVTAVSTVYKTGTDAVTGSVGASPDTPGAPGGSVGSAHPGDTIKWVVNYKNNTGSNAAVNVTDPLTNAGAFVPGSLVLPPNPNAAGSLMPQFSTNGGGTWSAGTPPANANGIGFTSTSFPAGTLQAGAPFPAPTSVNIGQSGGDGYNAVTSSGATNVYTVYHHNNSFSLFCSTSAGAVCPGWPAQTAYASPVAGSPINTGPYNMTTAWQNGVFISNGNLYWEASQSAAVGGRYAVGVMCLNLTSLQSCGFAQLSTVAVSPPNSNSGGIGGSGIAAPNGNYYFADTVGELLCFNPVSGPCGVVLLAAAAGVADAVASTYGNYVFAQIQLVPGGGYSMYCFNTATSSVCPGYPVPTPMTPLGAVQSPTGEPAPILDATGAVTGVCVMNMSARLGCWNLAGSVVANPYPAGYGWTPRYTGDALNVGSKVYLPTNSDNSVGCVDFAAAGAPCAGFTPVANPINYTTRQVTGVPGCLISAGDGGRITSFSSVTGGPCSYTTSGQAVAPADYYCGSGAAGFHGWNQLTLTGLTPSAYSEAVVSLADKDGNPIPGFQNRVLPAGTTTLDISSIPATGSTSSIRTTVILLDVNSPAGVTAGQTQLSWVGDALQMCFQTTAPVVACDATALTISNTADAITDGGAVNDKPNGNSSGSAAFTVTPATGQCSIHFAKSSPNTIADLGSTVPYTITVTNTGSLPYDSAAFQDDLSGVLVDATYNSDATASSGAVAYSAPTLSWSGSLAPGAKATITYTATVKPAVTGSHFLDNSVVSTTVGNNCPAGTTDPACRVRIPIPDISIVKSASPSDSASFVVGQVITYSFVATNTGSVTLTNPRILEGQFTGSGVLSPVTCPPTPTLAPGAQMTCTATYTLLQADIDGGSVNNDARATGTPPTGSDVTSPPSFVALPVPPAPALILTKTADTSGVGSPAKAGDTITYHFSEQNTGNVTLTNVSITDPLPGLSALVFTWPGTPGTLVPGQTVSATATYHLTQANLDAEHVSNTATGSGTPPTGPPVSPPPRTVDVPLPATPGISLVKSASASGAASFTVGQLITYSFVVTNTGNVTLSNPTVAEGAFTGSGVLSPVSCPPTQSLAPGAQMTCTATYTIVQADVDRGSVVNDASASGTPPIGPVVTSPKSEVSIPQAQSPALTLVKTADTSALSSPAKVGDTVTYNFTERNTGNVTLTNVSITDPSPGLSPLIYSWPGVAGTLVPGQAVTASATYQVTQADLNAGHVVNTATGAGTPPTGPPVAPPPPRVDTPLPPAPALILFKTADTSELSSPAKAGDTVTYNFVEQNTGNVTLTGVSIADPLPGLSALTYTWPGAAGTLTPGQTVTASATYHLKQSDVDAGRVSNTATGSGTPPTGRPVAPPPPTAQTPLPPAPALTLAKTADASQVTDPAKVGETITYHFTETNTGNVTLTGVSIIDPLPGLSALVYTWPGTPGILAPGQVVSAVATYKVTQADLNAGLVSNTATGTGTPPTGDPVVPPVPPTVDTPLMVAIVLPVVSG